MQSFGLRGFRLLKRLNARLNPQHLPITNGAEISIYPRRLRLSC